MKSPTTSQLANSREKERSAFENDAHNMAAAPPPITGSHGFGRLRQSPTSLVRVRLRLANQALSYRQLISHRDNQLDDVRLCVARRGRDGATARRFVGKAWSVAIGRRGSANQRPPSVCPDGPLNSPTTVAVQALSASSSWRQQILRSLFSDSRRFPASKNAVPLRVHRALDARRGQRGGSLG